MNRESVRSSRLPFLDLRYVERNEIFKAGHGGIGCKLHAPQSAVKMLCSASTANS